VFTKRVALNRELLKTSEFFFLMARKIIFLAKIFFLPDRKNISTARKIFSMAKEILRLGRRKFSPARGEKIYSIAAEQAQAPSEGRGMKPQPTEVSAFADIARIPCRRRPTTPLAAVSYRFFQAVWRWCFQSSNRHISFVATPKRRRQKASKTLAPRDTRVQGSAHRALPTRSRIFVALCLPNLHHTNGDDNSIERPTARFVARAW